MPTRTPVKPVFRRFTWKWLTILVLLTAGLVWILMTSINVEPQLYSPFITMLRYVLPFTLLFAVAVWILRQFPYKVQTVPIEVKHHAEQSA